MKYRILLATGIYPPDIGGPAQYVKNLAEEFKRQGHRVSVLTYHWEKKLPTGLRHLVFFFKVLARLPGKNSVIAFDSASVGWPTVLAARCLGKKVIIRLGGDFLWESYLNRTGEKILLRDFYQTAAAKWNGKEKIIYRLTKWALQKAAAVVFSTQWQKDIFTPAYGLDPAKNFVIENHYGEKTFTSASPAKKVFLSGARNLAWKNPPWLKEIFRTIAKDDPDFVLDDHNAPYSEFLEKLKQCYAVILVSLSDISPNLILEAIGFGKPFIVTRENGLLDRLGQIGIFVNPLDQTEIKEKILWLGNPTNYDEQQAKVRAFAFTHSWIQIGQEFLALHQKL